MLDLLIIVIVMALAAIGYTQGFVVGAASLGGIFLGGTVGTRLVHILLERSLEDSAASVWAPVVGLVIGVIITLVGAMAMQDLGSRVQEQFRHSEHGVVLDHLLGAALMAMFGLFLAWFAAASVMATPKLRDVRPQLVNSRVVGVLNAKLPDAGPLIGAINAYDPFPVFDGGAIDTPAPDARLPQDQNVREASRSVVRVVGSACGYRVTGSGWVASDGYVITNAHVVAGQSDTHVEPTATTRDLKAHVVAFDPRNDIAVLRVKGLDLEPLSVVAEPQAGTASVLLGYPEQRGFSAIATRFADERSVRASDIYGRGDFVRDITSFRGTVRHGNSGGPVVDRKGNVLTTVFAATVDEKIAGGYGVPNRLVEQALRRAQSVPINRALATGKCVS